jgi:peptidoglycan/xylan/chitin deacetylase (PgdA/CDA1 family)
MKAILTYHSIDDTGSPISISPAGWAAHAKWLSSGAVRVLGLDDLMAHPHDGPDAIAVTFDDGFQNVRTALEDLRSNGVPVTLFVVSGHAGGTNAWGGREQPGIPTLPLLNWAALEHLIGRGVSIQAHTRTHPRLTRIAGAALAGELLGCREDLRARLGIRTAHVAYPYGDVNDAVADCAADAFLVGHTTDFRALKPGDDARRMPRLDMYYFREPGQLEAWGKVGFRRRLAWIRARRAVRALLGEK